MNNYQARAYASIALRNLQARKEKVTEQALKAEMIYLMDMYSEKEIERKMEE